MNSSKRNCVASFAAAVVVALMIVPAAAQQPEINVQRFEASPHEGDIMSIRTASQPGEDGFSGGFFINYARNPLRLYDKRFPQAQTFQLVDTLVMGDFFAAYSLWKSLSIGVNIPVAMLSEGSSGFPGTAPADGGGLGDVKLSVRYLIIPRAQEGFGLGFEALVGFPTATSGAWVGDANLTVTPRLIADWKVSNLLLAANAGYRIRESQALAAYDVGGELLFGLGAEYRLLEERLGLMAELQAATNQEDFFGSNGTSVEGQVGANYCVAGISRLFLAGGGGLTSGLGDPSLRVTGGVRFESCGKPEVEAPVKVLDKDGDGVPDQEDACVDVPGVATKNPKTNGCPSDKDGDGIYDKDDACVDVPGVKTGDPKTNGCPSDKDGDGIYDKDDACPDVPGPRSEVKELNGCPPPKVTEKKIEILQRIEFEVDSDVLLPASERILDEVARVITENPKIKSVSIEGHTDNTGAAAHNRTLSLKRAKSVREYLIKKGIDGKMLKTVGFGPGKPIADNDTDEGRQKNRRVEFNIKLDK